MMGGTSVRNFGLGSIQPWTAIGGTIRDSGGYRYHLFTSSENFIVTGSGQKTVYYQLFGGGGSGGGVNINELSYPTTTTTLSAHYFSGGGGGGGLASNNEILGKGIYPVVIGAGGSLSNGSNTTFRTRIGAGGGRGTTVSVNINLTSMTGSFSLADPPGGHGGGGGWAGAPNTTFGNVGSSGRTGGQGSSSRGGGGSGQAENGYPASSTTRSGGGALAYTTDIFTGILDSFSGGGGGGGTTVAVPYDPTQMPTGGLGGANAGTGGAIEAANSSSSPYNYLGVAASEATANRAGGGGGGALSARSYYNIMDEWVILRTGAINPSNGGSGIAVIYYQI